MRRHRAALQVACAVVLVLGVAACGDDDGGTDEAGTAVDATTPGTVDGDPGTTREPPPPPGPDMVRCQSEEGFSIDHPQDWHTNPGDVLPACSLFGPEPFEVAPDTDERVAPIAVYIDPVPFEEVATPVDAETFERTDITVDGLPAVRRSYDSVGSGLWPDGTPITSYLVDLSSGVDGPRRTLFMDAIGLPAFDHEADVAVLDRMARTLRVDLEDRPTLDR